MVNPQGLSGRSKIKEWTSFCWQKRGFDLAFLKVKRHFHSKHRSFKSWSLLRALRLVTWAAQRDKRNRSQRVQSCWISKGLRGCFQNKGMVSRGKSFWTALCWLISENFLFPEFMQNNAWNLRTAAESLSPAVPQPRQQHRGGTDLLTNKWFNPFVYNEIV